MVCVAVGEDLADVGRELLLVVVLSSIHLAFDRAEIHRHLNLCQVIRYAIFDRADRFAERTDQTSPETY